MSKKKFEIGELVEGEGVFIGTWEPELRGASLGKTFNVFAAPTDLTDDAGKRTELSFKDTRTRIEGLQNWHDHDGSKHANEDALVKAIEKGKYTGGWVMPPSRVLCDIGYQRDKGALANSFARVSYQPPYSRDDYWSSREQRFQGEAMVWAAPISLPQIGTLHGKENQNFCRPVRFVEIKK